MKSRTEYFRKYREKNREKCREYNRFYNKIWRYEHGYHNERASEARYPKKLIARKIAQKAIADGLIERKPCQACGLPNGQAHHDDYSKPLELKFFCPLHHREYEKGLSTGYPQN